MKAVFNITHIGFAIPHPEAAALHLEKHFGFEKVKVDPDIYRYTLKKEGFPQLELNRGEESPSQHIGFGFKDRTEAWDFFQKDIPAEIVAMHAKVMKEERKRGKRPHGIIRFRTISGLGIELMWGDQSKAHDN